LRLAWQLDPTLLGLAAKLSPKHFQKESPTLGHVAQQDPVVLGLAQNTSKRGWVCLPSQTHRS